MTTPPSRAALVAALRSIQRLQVHVDRHPLEYSRWTTAQLDYLKRRSRRKLLRLGNGGGKSWVALADVEFRAEKAHPFRPDWNARRGPQHQWIVTYSWSQAIPLMRDFRAFINWDRVVQAPRWDPAKGWGKDSPCIVYDDGSTVTWKTVRQGPLAHAGAKLDHILVDEPCSMEHYRELERRVFRRGGDLSLALTPVNAPGDLTWLRDMVTEGTIDEVWYPMTEDLFRFDDGSLRTLIDGTICNQAWIEEQSLDVPLKWRDIVIHGGWDEIAVDALFAEVFSRDRHFRVRRPPAGKIPVSLGLDHGTQRFTETGVLVAVDERPEYPHVYVMDCHEAEENSPSEDDARAYLAMLRRNRLKWGDLNYATGDIAHYGGRRNRVGRKSNAELAAELAREMKLKRNQALAPPIRTAKTGKGAGPRGSRYRGESWLHRAMRREAQLTILPRAARVAEAIEKYRGGSTDPHGHLVDALRYALDPWIFKGQTRNVASARLYTH